MKERMECLAPWALRACGIDWNGGCPIPVAVRLRRGKPVFDPVLPDALEAVRKSDRTVLCGALPPGRAMAVWLRTPLRSPAKAVRVLPTLLDVAMPFALEDCLYGFSPLVRALDDETVPATAGNDGPCLAALAVAARRDDVIARLARYADHGWDPHVLDQEGLALWTEAQRSVPATDAAGVRVVVWVRENEMVIALGTGTRFWSAHHLTDMSGDVLVRTIRVQLDAVAGGRYSRAPLTWLWGGTAADTLAALRSRAEGALPSVASRDLPRGELFLAGALAVRALVGGPLRFNLRRDSLVHPAAARQAGLRCRRQAAWLAVAALVLIAVNTACMHARSLRRRQGQEQLKAAIEQVAGRPVAEAGRYGLLVAQRELEVRQAAYQPVIRMFGPSLLETLGRVLKAASAVSLQSLRLDFGTVAMRGQAESPTAVKTLSGNLGDIGYAVRVRELSETGVPPLDFEITGVAGGQP